MVAVVFCLRAPRTLMMSPVVKPWPVRSTVTVATLKVMSPAPIDWSVPSVKSIANGGTAAVSTSSASRFAPLRVCATPRSSRMLTESCNIPAGRVRGFKREA
jgi:hypothetical protein